MIKGKSTAHTAPSTDSFFSRIFGGDKNGFRSPSSLMSHLGSLQTNIFFADSKFNLVYANPKAIETLREIEDEVKKAFRVSVDEILGGSIHRFHKDSRRIEKILQNPNALPHEAEFSFGPVTLKTKINGAYDATGKTLGYVVNWENVTETKKTEALAAQVQSMMQNAPVNVMFAGQDLKFRYLNPASIKTLKTLEHYLPVKVDAIIGQSVDIFHKNPGKQRKLLSDPNNLPYRALIEVGPEKLDLFVTAIYDQNRNYIGPMVTWEIITRKLKTETQIAQVMSMMEQAPINVMFSDLSHTIQYMNPASTKTLRILEAYMPIKADQREKEATENIRNVSDAARSGAEIAQNIAGVSQAANSTTQGATDTQKAAAELSKMANDLQKIISQFKA